MNNPPAFQFYPAEYLADENVAVMTLEEEGAYWRAVAYCWREGSIPADDERLSRLLKGASTTVLRVVRKCFNQCSTTPDRLVHPRLEKERIKQAEWRAKSAAGGKRSGKVRRDKKLRAEPPFINGSKVVEPPYEPNANSSSSSLSSSEEQIQELSLSSTASTRPGPPAENPEPPPVKPNGPVPLSPRAPLALEKFAEAWNDNCGHLPRIQELRQSRRKKLSARIREGLTLERFLEAVKCCREKPFLRGDGPRGWMATFDWLLENDRNVEKAITDPYEMGNGTPKPVAVNPLDKMNFVNARRP